MNICMYIMITVAITQLISICQTSFISASKRVNLNLTRFQDGLRKPRAASSENSFSWVQKVEDNAIKDQLPNTLGKSLRIIGLFLAAHKYFATDTRYAMASENLEKPKFFKHFPIPRLRQQHPSVVQACDKDLIQCVDEIYKKANMSGSLANIHKNFGNKSIQYASYHPFKDDRELFRYRVTASYYMCWYTDKQERPLALPDTKDCFEGLELTEEANGRKVEDFRSKIEFPGRLQFMKKYSIYTCAYLWFCPDPCYGKSTGGNVKSQDEALYDKLNPCGSLFKKDCFWKIGRNSVFEDLTRNKFNYSCDCTSVRNGYIWSPAYSICVDQDECYDGVSECPKGKICRNTVGGYTCTCRRGYYFDKNETMCKRHELLSPAAAQALEKQKKAVAEKKEQHSGVLFILKILVELARGHCSTICLSKLLLSSVTVFYFILVY